MQKYKYILLALLTIISGALSVYSTDIAQVVVLFGPGLVFGVIIGSWFYITQKSNLLKVIFWAALSALAYFLAIEIALHFPVSNGNIGSGNLGLILAGFTGSAILTASTCFLIKKLSGKPILTVIILGSLAGIFFSDSVRFLNLNVYGAFIIWQMAVGIALGVNVDRNNKTI